MVILFFTLTLFFPLNTVRRNSFASAHGKTDNTAAVERPCIYIVNGFGRHAAIAAIVRHYAAMDVISKIVVNWGNPVVAPTFLYETLKALGELSSRIIVIEQSLDDLNLRFHPDLASGFECVIVADDDIFVSEQTVRTLIDIWYGYPERIVGLFPRNHNEYENGFYTYDSNPSVQYSMILTKFMLIHSKYMFKYFSESMTNVRAYVSKQCNCEDIAMNFLVANLTSKAPIYVRDTNKLDIGGHNGLYNRPQHILQRTSCLQEISSLLNGIELKHSRVQIETNSITHFNRDAFREPIADVETTLMRRLVLHRYIFLSHARVLRSIHHLLGL